MAKRVALFQELFVTEFRRRHPELGADATELEALLRRCVTSWWNFMLASPSVRTALARELRHALTRAPDDPLILLCAAVATRADGKQAMWLDGQLVGEFSGIRWRSDLDLKVNCLWLEHYGYDDSDPTKQFWKDSQTVWFDDVVVARQYIGPRQRQ